MSEVLDVQNSNSPVPSVEQGIDNIDRLLLAFESRVAPGSDLVFGFQGKFGFEHCDGFLIF